MFRRAVHLFLYLSVLLLVTMSGGNCHAQAKQQNRSQQPQKSTSNSLLGLWTAQDKNSFFVPSDVEFTSTELISPGARERNPVKYIIKGNIIIAFPKARQVRVCVMINDNLMGCDIAVQLRYEDYDKCKKIMDRGGKLRSDTRSLGLFVRVRGPSVVTSPPGGKTGQGPAKSKLTQPFVGATGSTPMEAAQNAMKLRAADNIEHGGWIISNPNGTGFLAYESGTGNDKVFALDPPPSNWVASWHTHPIGAYSGSDTVDQWFADRYNIPGYVADPNGNILLNTPDPNFNSKGYNPPPLVQFNGVDNNRVKGTATNPFPPISIVGRWK